MLTAALLKFKLYTSNQLHYLPCLNSKLQLSQHLTAPLPLLFHIPPSFNWLKTTRLNRPALGTPSCGVPERGRTGTCAPV